MKRLYILAISLSLVVLLCSCGLSEEVQNAYQLIQEIGTVTLDSGSNIVAAENAVSNLDEKDYEKVENISILEEARVSYNKLVDNHVNELLQGKDFSSAKSFLENLDVEALASAKNIILKNVSVFLSDPSYSRVSLETKKMVDSFLDILALLPLEAEEEKYTNDLTAIQDFQTRNEANADFMELVNLYNTQITEADNELMAAFNSSSIPMLTNAYDTYASLVDEIQYSGNEENALRYVQVNADAKNAIGTMLLGLNQRNNSLYRQGVEEIQDVIQEKIDLSEIVIAINQESIKLLQTTPTAPHN